MLIHNCVNGCVGINRTIYFSAGWAEHRREDSFFEMGIFAKQLGNNYIRERNFEQCRKSP